MCKYCVGQRRFDPDTGPRGIFPEPASLHPHHLSSLVPPGCNIMERGMTGSNMSDFHSKLEIILVIPRAMSNEILYSILKEAMLNIGLLKSTVL